MNEYFATKYQSAAAEVIAHLADPAEGFGIETSGDTDSPTGYFAIVQLDATCDLDFSDHTNYPEGDYVGHLARHYGVTAADVLGAHLVTWDSSGFVTVETFPTLEQARQQFECRAARYAFWADEERVEDDELYVCPVDGHGYHQV